MKKYKICVYAICKNEEKFVDGWVESMSEADEIIVMDTGSTDNTVKKLKEKSVKVYEKIISPWRFDVARNECLKLVSDDIDFCCCIDLDERFVCGWRELLEKSLNDDISQVHYRYCWNYNDDGNEGIVFFANKIHRNKLFVWEHPVHETLKQIDFTKTKTITIPTLQLNHFADNTKSRSSYLPLLELSVKEDPNNDRNVHYLGREYFFYHRYEDSIKILKKHLSMPNSIWAEERSASCRIIGDSYYKLNKHRLALQYYKQAIIECPTIREPYLTIGKYYFLKEKYFDSQLYLLPALNIKNRELNYMSLPECWNEYIYDILALNSYYLKEYKNACQFCEKALSFSPNNKRLINNYNIYLLHLNNKTNK